MNSPENFLDAVSRKVVHLQHQRDVMDTGRPSLPILTSREFVEGYNPPHYVLEGILLRGFFYSLTAATGTGKTALSQLLAASVARQVPFAGLVVEQGSVLVLAGENPDDMRMRWIGLAHCERFDSDKIDVTFIPERFSIPDKLDEIDKLASHHGGFGLVIVETSAAYFLGDNENDNTQAGDHARTLRSLTKVTGDPTVIVNCHPIKSTKTKEDLIPRGGGAFLNEVDGNLCCYQQEGSVELHWIGKFRGPDFRPFSFELKKIDDCQALVNSKGVIMPTVVAQALSDTEVRAKSEEVKSDLRILLNAVANHPGASLAQLARACKWLLTDGSPHKTKATRRLNDLKKQRLVDCPLGEWVLTPAGKRAAGRS